MTKKFIEELFPIEKISKFGSKEKSTPVDNISGIHIWWARRPTSMCRALILACLFKYPDNNNLRERIKKFIIECCSDYKKIPNLVNYQEKLKKLIYNDLNNEKIKLLDLFSGGSAIPLEAARIGLDSNGIDLNPVAVLIGKATCEYLPKYHQKIIGDLRKFWKLLQKELIKELKQFYNNPVNDNIILAFIWTRQIKCINSKCSALIPLMQDLKLVSNKKKKSVLKPRIIKKKNQNIILFDIQEGETIDFDPNNNKIFSGGKITCPACGITIDNQETMDIVKQMNFDDKLLIIVEKDKKSKKRVYRLATDLDNAIYQKVKEKLKILNNKIPKKKLPERVNLWSIQNYGILEWQQFFNERQILLYVIFSEKIKEIFPKILDTTKDKDYSVALTVFLAFILTRSLTHNSKFTHWYVRDELISQTWSRSGIFMKGQYPEHNPFADFSGTPNRYLDFLEKITKNNINFSNFAKIKQGNATNLDFKNDSIDLIVTDPPYYDAMLYANPSDFFYIWLQKCLENIMPELFLFPLTPKDEEIIQNKYRHNGDNEKAKIFYEVSLSKVLKECHRVLKPDGIGVLMYTHKSVDAWEVLINAIINSELTISAAWPIETETKGGIRSLNRVVLASTIVIVFKKKKKEKDIFFETQFTNILEIELKVKLKRLLVDLEIYGADFFISAIGSSLNIFTRYENIISQKTGVQVSVSVFLDLVRKIVNDFLLSTVLEKNITKGIDEISNLYIIWCWFFRNNGINLDDALKLAQSFGVGELNELRKRKMIKLEKKNFKLLLASDKAREDYLIKNRIKLISLIDNLHLLAILWKNNDKDLNKEVKRVETEFSENIWKVGQALAEFFPNNHKEHNYLQGLLARYGKAKSKSDLKKWI